MGVWFERKEKLELAQQKSRLPREVGFSIPETEGASHSRIRSTSFMTAAMSTFSDV